MPSGPAPELLAWCEGAVGRVGEATLVSKRNSLVWCIRTQSGSYILKLLRDRSSDLESELRIGRELASDLRFALPVATCELEHGERAVLRAYVEGDPLDAVLASGRYGRTEERRWAVELDVIFRRLATGTADWLRRSRRRRERAVSIVVGSSCWSTRSRNGARRPRMGALRHDAIEASLAEYAPLLDHVVTTPVRIAADVNCGNFVVSIRSDRHLTMVNIPLIWNGDVAHQFGEALMHLDGTGVDHEPRSRAEPAFGGRRLDLYAAFNACRPVICRTARQAALGAWHGRRFAATTGRSPCRARNR
jgi:hypothetical protein